MKFRHLPARFVFATLLATSTLTVPTQLFAQGVPAQQAADNALLLFNDGRYKEALDAYEAIIKDYPTSLLVWEARFRAGYLHFLLRDFDKAITRLREVKDPASKEVQELAAGAIPQALAGKAAEEKDEKKREAGLKEAIKAYDAFLQAYPSSQSVESAIYGRALCAFQLGEYTQAVEGLRSNLQRFPRSESVLDSQYLLALTLATEGAQAMQKSATDTAAAAKFNEAEKLLQDIITKRQDIALLNDAQFQIGELRFNRAMLGPREQMDESLQSALTAYRAVQNKEPMVKAQEARVNAVKNRKLAAMQARNVAEYQRLQPVEDRERSKLEAVKAKGDLTIDAKLKSAQVFFQLRAYDEARTLLRYIQQFAGEEEQKKAILYYVTLTYASQNLRDQAVAAYDLFQASFKGDAMADNLPLVVGSLFLTEPADPATATKYFEEGTKLYPKGRFVGESIKAQAAALLQQRKYDEALKAYRDYLASNPEPEQAAQAEFGIATVLRETKKLPEATAEFKKIRDTRTGTPEAEQAAFWVGQIALMSNDFPTVITEMTDFLTKHPKSELGSAAKFALAQAETPKNKARALELYKEVSDEYPDSPAAPYAYFQRAALLSAEQKFDEVIPILNEFIERYPSSPMVFNAYQTIGQIKLSTGKLEEAIATYAAMVEKHPQDPQAPAALLNVAQYWLRHTEAQGRYLALNEEQRAEWTKGIEGSRKAGEQMLNDYAAAPQVALALKTLLANQKLQVAAQLKTDEDITKYFEQLAAGFDSAPETQSKVLFTLASYTFEKDAAKAVEQMDAAYKPDLIYAPDDLDLYGAALLDEGKVAESDAVYKKLASDYPNPPGVDPARAPTAVQEAQAISLFGQAKALQKEGKTDDAAKLFAQLKQLYPWSPKLLEANYGIAEQKFEEKQYQESLGLLIAVIRANTATAELRAKSILLLGKVQHAQGDIPAAIDQFIKVSAFYEAEARPAAEGLWLGGQLLEEQAATLPDSVPAGSKNPTKPGQLAKAYRAYKDILDKYPDSEYAPKAKERLQFLPPPATR